MIDYTGETYEIKKLPLFQWKQGRNRLHYLSGTVFIHPFVFNAEVYLSLHGLCCNEDRSAWHVIARYRQGATNLQQLEDVCYVQRRKR